MCSSAIVTTLQRIYHREQNQLHCVLHVDGADVFAPPEKRSQIARKKAQDLAAEKSLAGDAKDSPVEIEKALVKKIHQAFHANQP